MAAGVTIKIKRKAGAFVDGELAAGELGLDVTNSDIYFSINGTIVTLLDTGGGVDEITELIDVVISAPADNEVLAWDNASGKWINQTAAEAALVAEARIGAASGVAALDAGGKVPVAQLPDTVVGAVEYQGSWNANTNSPALASGVGTKGDYYVVSTAGATPIDGITDWKVGDWIIFNGTVWEKVDNTDQVVSVHGRQGAVVAAASDYDASQVDNDSGVAGATVAAALNTLDAGKAATAHTHDAADINAGNLATARMQTNVVAAVQAGGGGTISNAALVIDGGTL